MNSTSNLNKSFSDDNKLPKNVIQNVYKVFNKRHDPNWYDNSINIIVNKLDANSLALVAMYNILYRNDNFAVYEKNSNLNNSVKMYGTVIYVNCNVGCVGEKCVNPNHDTNSNYVPYVSLIDYIFDDSLFGQEVQHIATLNKHPNILIGNAGRLYFNNIYKLINGGLRMHYRYLPIMGGYSNLQIQVEFYEQFIKQIDLQETKYMHSMHLEKFNNIFNKSNYPHKSTLIDNATKYITTLLSDLYMKYKTYKPSETIKCTKYTEHEDLIYKNNPLGWIEKIEFDVSNDSIGLVDESNKNCKPFNHIYKVHGPLSTQVDKPSTLAISPIFKVKPYLVAAMLNEPYVNSESYTQNITQCSISKYSSMAITQTLQGAKYIYNSILHPYDNIDIFIDNLKNAILPSDEPIYTNHMDWHYMDINIGIQEHIRYIRLLKDYYCPEIQIIQDPPKPIVAYSTESETPTKSKPTESKPTESKPTESETPTESKTPVLKSSNYTMDTSVTASNTTTVTTIPVSNSTSVENVNKDQDQFLCGIQFKVVPSPNGFEVKITKTE